MNNTTKFIKTAKNEYCYIVDETNMSFFVVKSDELVFDCCDDGVMAVVDAFVSEIEKTSEYSFISSDEFLLSVYNKKVINEHGDKVLSKIKKISSSKY